MDISSNVKFTPARGRKKTKDVGGWKRVKEQTTRHKPKGLPSMPSCAHKKKTFYCKDVSMQDIRRFHQAFYSTYSKIVQDQFILKHTTQQIPQRRRSLQNKREGNNVTISYFINTKNKGMRQVCYHITFHK